MTATTSASLERCPNCEAAGFGPAGQTVTLADTLRDWEIQGNLTFPQKVRDDYAANLAVPLRLHRCPACHFKQFVPPLAGTGSFYEAITTGGEAYYTQDRWEFRKAIAAIRKFDGKTVLDAGCGGGAFLRQLRAAGSFSAYGYDFNPDTPATLAADGIPALADMDEQVVPGGFDVVTCFQVLEHLANPWSFGEKLRRQLKAGGLLILTTPDAAGPISNFTNSVTDLPPHHVSRWDKTSMAAFGARFGFKLRRIRHEPLPNYVWRYYLPVVIRNAPLPKYLTLRLANRAGRFLDVLERFGVKELPPLRGHSLYAEFEG